MEWISVLLLGFFLGMRHSTDADHVVAVTTIVSEQKKLTAASLIGALWGVGHTLTILLIGSAIIYMKWSIPPYLGLSMEFSVGVMIVVLGIMGLRHYLPHKHPSTDGETPSSAKGSLRRRLIRPFVVGIVHGMAGSAAVALLVLNAISDQRLAFVYLLIFGLGTVAGMMLVTFGLGLPYIFSQGFGRFHRYLGLATAVFGIVFGLSLMYELGIVNGLFTAQPVWHPE